MVKILDGRVVQAGIKKKLIATCSGLVRKPHLVIIQVGKRPESTLYIERKKKFGEQIGVKITHAHYPQAISEVKLISEIINFNNDGAVHGIIVQIPLPKQLNTTRILNTISAVKDVDGLSAVNLQRAWQNDQGGFRPATACGVLILLEHYKIPLRGRTVVIIGRSALVGKHLALACLNAGATVTICHRETKNLSAITKQSDILIVSAGSPGLITKKYVRAGQVVVDVGINVLPGQKLLEEVGKRKIVGDVAYDEVASIVRAISPVPGGVGPLTIACLFENLVEAYKFHSR
jgi:methylenetetrahydrofolate dehydrogenase (NADP+)/methenyltetrahydrofolate cyclohydrolase